MSKLAEWHQNAAEFAESQREFAKTGSIAFDYHDKDAAFHREAAEAIREVEKALEFALKEAEGWVHDQLDGTSMLKGALEDLEPARKSLAKLREVAP